MSVEYNATRVPYVLTTGGMSLPDTLLLFLALSVLFTVSGLFVVLVLGLGRDRAQVLCVVVVHLVAMGLIMLVVLDALARYAAIAAAPA